MRHTSTQPDHVTSKKSNSDELARQILEVIILIPCGKVMSYGQVAKMAGLPKHARLVGYVLKHLDAESEVPWHRVINSKGQVSLNKNNSKGENIQKMRLMDEGVDILNDKVNLKKFAWIL